MTTKERNLLRYPRGIADLPIHGRFCSNCRKYKPKEQFYFIPTRSNAISNKCIECQIIYGKERYKRNFKRIPDDTLVKCIDCHKIRPAKLYHRFRYKSNGILSRCRYCENKRQKRLKLKQNGQ